MNRKIFLLIPIIILLILIKSAPALTFYYGKNLMQKQEYVKAYSYFKYAYSLDKNNKEYKYYYALALTKLKPTIEIQKELFNIANQEEQDSAKTTAQIKLSKWKNTILQNYGDNYIEQTTINNGIIRWDTDKFPIKIAIIDSCEKSIPPYYHTEILKAFSQWQSSIDFLKFSKIKSAKNADIIVEIAQIPSNLCDGNVCQFVAGYTYPDYSGHLLKKMSIILYSTDPYGRYFSDKEIYNTILHEIGHALGIMGHSYNSEDLMYMSQNNNNNIYAKYKSSFQYLSSKDINTIKLLYKLAPDITNNRNINTEGLIYPPIILGTSKDIANRKLKEAQNYVKKAPDMPNGYVDLAEAYANLNKPREAIKAMTKAYELSKTASEKYMSAYNLASIYLENGDTKNALKYAQIAKEINSTEEINELITNIKVHENH